MLGVGQGIEEFLITRRPADVVARAGIGAVKAERVAQAGIRWQDFLDLDPMLPVAAEVIADAVGDMALPWMIYLKRQGN